MIARTGTALFALQVAHLWAQTPPAFAVASVKMMRGPCSSALVCSDAVQITPSGITAPGLSLGLLLRWAYGLHMHQQPPVETVGPAWMEPGGDWVRYHVVAKADNPATLPELRAMLRNLLADRLKLVTHRETREIPVYVLSKGKPGLKLHPSEGDVDSRFTPPVPPPGEMWWWGVWRFEGFQMSGMHDFLWPFLPTVVLDETGLQGRYDFSLNIGKYRDYYETPSPGGRADLGPALNRALQEVGLQLQLVRRPTEVLVIDHVEKMPAEN